MLKHNQRAQTSPALERNCYLLLPVCQARVDTLVSWQRVIAEGSYHWATVAAVSRQHHKLFLFQSSSFISMVEYWDTHASVEVSITFSTIAYDMVWVQGFKPFPKGSEHWAHFLNVTSTN